MPHEAGLRPFPSAPVPAPTPAFAIRRKRRARSARPHPAFLKNDHARRGGEPASVIGNPPPTLPQRSNAFAAWAAACPASSPWRQAGVAHRAARGKVRQDLETRIAARAVLEMVAWMAMRRPRDADASADDEALARETTLRLGEAALSFSTLPDATARGAARGGWSPFKPGREAVRSVRSAGRTAARLSAASAPRAGPGRASARRAPPPLAPSR